MTISRGSALPHWRYYLALESDYLRLERFVDFSGNDDTYSIEIARLLMSACAEVDVVLKQLCERWSPGCGASSIGAYFEVVAAHLPELIEFPVSSPRFELSFTPWIDWTKEDSPGWWTANNKVKHHRHTEFAQATLKNCLNAGAALLSLNLFLYREEATSSQLIPTAQVFNAAEGYIGWGTPTELGLALGYVLPDPR